MKLIDARKLEKEMLKRGAMGPDSKTPTWSKAICCIHDAPAVNQWVTDGVPQTDDTVLCCTQKKDGHRNIVIGYYMNDAWHCGMNSNVVAWMPLPEMPEE